MSDTHVRAFIRAPRKVKPERAEKRSDTRTPASDVFLGGLRVTDDGELLQVHAAVIQDGYVTECRSGYGDTLLSEQEVVQLQSGLVEWKHGIAKKLGLKAINWERTLEGGIKDGAEMPAPPMTVKQFIDWLYRMCQDDGATLVTDPFTLSRLMSRHSSPRNGAFKGGFTIKLCNHEYGRYRKGPHKGEFNPKAGCRHHPRFKVKRVGTNRYLMGMQSEVSPNSKEAGRKVRNRRFDNVRIVTLANLSGALLNDANLSLAGLCEALDLPRNVRSHERAKIAIPAAAGHMPDCKDTMPGKRSPITLKETALDRQDVTAMMACYYELKRRYEEYGLDKRIDHLYSPGSLTKGLLSQLGMRPFMHQHANFPVKWLSWSMASYYGGRIEARIRNTITHGLYNDFKGQYATAQILMGLQDIMLCDHVDIDDSPGAVEWVRRLLSLPRAQLLEWCHNKANWPLLLCLIRVQSTTGHLLPVRDYWQHGNETNSYLSIELAVSRHETSMVYTPADLIGATLHAGEPPEILEAVRFSPSKEHYPTDKVDLLGTGHIIDLEYENLLTVMGDTRTEYKELYAETGDQRYEHMQKTLKLMASALAGVLMEITSDTRSKPFEFTWPDIDGNINDAKNTLIEYPGPWFSPFGTFITAAGRLMMSLAEVLFNDRGIQQAMIATDCMFTIMPDEVYEVDGRDMPSCYYCGNRDNVVIGRRNEYYCTEHDRDGAQLGRLVQVNDSVREWFRSLSPYAGQPDILELEKENFVNGKLTPLCCLSIQPNLFVLFRELGGARYDIRKLSRHVIGNFIAPYEDDASPFIGKIPAPSISLKELGYRRWQYDVWHSVIQAIDTGCELSILEHPSFSIPAMHRVMVSSQGLLKTHPGSKPFDSFTLLQQDRHLMPPGYESELELAEFVRDMEDGALPESVTSDEYHDLLLYKRFKESATTFYFHSGDPRNLGIIRASDKHDIAPSWVTFKTLATSLDVTFSVDGDRKPIVMTPRHVTINNLVYIGKDHDAIAAALDRETDGELFTHQQLLLGASKVREIPKVKDVPVHTDKDTAKGLIVRLHELGRTHEQIAIDLSIHVRSVHRIESGETSGVNHVKALEVLVNHYTNTLNKGEDMTDEQWLIDRILGAGIVTSKELAKSVGISYDTLRNVKSGRRSGEKIRPKLLELAASLHIEIPAQEQPHIEVRGCPLMWSTVPFSRPSLAVTSASSSASNNALTAALAAALACW